VGLRFEEKIMNIVKKAILGAVAAVAMTTAAHASLFQINPVVSAEYDGTTGVLTKGQLGGTGLNSGAAKNVFTGGVQGRIYAIDLYVKYTPSAGEPSFGNMTFDIVPLPGAQRLAANVGAVPKRNYVPVATQFDSDGDTVNDTSYLAFNADAGADFAAVLAGVDTTVDASSFSGGDPRTTIGQSANPVFGTNPNGFLFGRTFIVAGGTTNPVQYNIFQPGSGSPPSVWNPPPGNNSVTNPADAAGVNGLAIITVPEPTTMLGLASVAGLALARRRRD